MHSKSKNLTAITLTTTASFMTAFMGSSTNIALPSIANEFHLTAVLLSWVALSFMLTAGVLVLPLGRIADIYGRKKIFTLGVFIFTCGSALCLFSFDIISLLVFRVIQGMGSSMIFATSIAILTSVFPKEERGKAIGINTASVYIGLSSGPFLGGYLTKLFGWRSIFFTAIPIGIFILIFLFIKIKDEWKDSHGESFDFVGTMLYGVFLVLLLLGFSNITAVFGKIFVALSLMFFIFFLFYESRINFPVLNIKLFMNGKVFAFSNIAALINYSATHGVGFLLSLYLQKVKLLSPEKAGLILLSQPIIQAIFSPLTGRLSDRVEPRILASLGMALTVTGLVFLSFLKIDTSINLIITSLMTLGLGFALFSSPNANAVMSSVEKKHYGVGGATLSTMRIVGQIMSMGCATLVFSIILGRAEIKIENQLGFLKSINITFSIFTVLCFIGIFFSFIRGKMHK